ncbi:MAG: hypothetical protein ABW023_15435 [Sphingomonas sp.]
MTSPKHDRGAPSIERDIGAADVRTDADRARIREKIREKLESGELVIEFEMEEVEETRH